MQLGTEAQRRLASAAAGTGPGAGTDLAAMLGAIMPALAHALAPTAELALPGGLSFDEGREQPFGAGAAGGDAAASAAASAAHATVPQRSSAAAVRTYRRLWLSLATLGLADTGAAIGAAGGGGGGGAGVGRADDRRWPPGWLRAVRAVAVVTPVLVLRPATTGDANAGASAGAGASTNAQAQAAQGPPL